jgi:uncharacterized protein (DUF58 family)
MRTAKPTIGIRPTRRAVLLFAAPLPLVWLALSYRSQWWPRAFDVTALVLLCLCVDAFFARPLRKIQAEVEAPPLGYIGEPVEAAIVLSAAGAASAPYELALDLGGDASPQTGADTWKVMGPHVRTEIRIQPRRRGELRIEKLWVRWRGPLGLIEQTRQFPAARRVAILPDMRAARGQALMLHFRDALYGTKAQRRQGEGSEFEALREFAPGLDPRFIDWKRSAHHRKLIAREFRVERNHPVVLAFDTGHLMQEPVDAVPRLDHSIGLGLMLARFAVMAGDLVGSYAFDSRPRQFLAPDRGMHAFRRLQQASAGIAYSSDETNFTLGLAELQPRLRRRGLVVLFTDFVDTVTSELLFENVRRIATRHLLIFVTIRDRLLADIFEAPPGDAAQVARAVLAADFRRERAIVLEKLERLGIQCLDLPPAELPMALLNRYLAIKQRGLL